MLSLESSSGVRSCDGMTRRDFLRVGALGAGVLGLSLADLEAATARRDVNCIVLFLVGGPSQLDTWDPKPDAPDSVRGPFRPVQTRIPGIRIAEHFPRMARMAEQYALVRSVHHQAAPIHETGHQLMQTGRLSQNGVEQPHFGAVVSHLRGRKPGGPHPFFVLPGPIGNTGVSVGHGQSAGFLGSGHEPVFLRVPDIDPARSSSKEVIDAVDSVQRSIDTHMSLPVLEPPAKQALHLDSESDSLRRRYGWNTFGQSCLLARRLIEGGVRLATVNMFDSVFNAITWDCHADGASLPTTLDDYRQTLCPMFDQAYSALLDDLHQRGLLDSTLVVAMGEFGRTPYLNHRGGRDHWPGCWSILFAGAGIRTGQVVGASDPIGAEPADRPVTPGEVAATIYQALGIDRQVRLAGLDGRAVPVVEAEPIGELLGSAMPPSEV